MTRIAGRHKILVQMIILVFLNVPFFYCCLFAFFLFGQKKPEDDQPKLSKKKLRKMNRLSVAELKQVRTV